MLRKILLLALLCTTSQLTAQCPDSIRVTDTISYVVIKPAPPIYQVFYLHKYKYTVYPESSFQNDTIILSNGSRFDTVITDSVFYSGTGLNPSDWEAVEITRNGSTVSCSVPLPVELVSFQAVRNDDRVTLEWRTASETNNRHFSVLRLADRKRWVEIARKAGHGTTITPRDYSYDLSDYEDVQYFMLKQVDYDGTEHLSNVIAVDFDTRNTVDTDVSLWIGNMKVIIRNGNKIIEKK